MVFRLCLCVVLLVACGYANISGNYCQVLDTYNTFKTSMDNFLASRDELGGNTAMRSDCRSILDEFPEAEDGVYRIKPSDGKGSFLAYCDMTQHGGGWLVFQRRLDGSEDFYRTWFEYMDGFGNLTREFWLGNEKIHRLTKQKTYELRIDLVNESGGHFYAEYNSFHLGSMSEFYTLFIGNYSGTAGDRMLYHNNTRFSAKNLDLDTYSGNCAVSNKGAWWSKSCDHSHLTRLYSVGLRWDGLSGLTSSSMKIRPLN
ncbi:fibrinogen-like protein A [Haliotis rubra]|uniref:fibrinogen-like protein A n=1 Tax=Haliotis rubra TaxID=36100 RepID=UPI001EE51F5F|nr:fibrinogen-like protein A [Haliotis rubra]